MSDLLVVTSELLTNATKVCSSSVELKVESHRDRIMVCVRDDHPGRAQVRQPDEGKEGGRGLPLVAALSERWGQTSFNGGKSVWAELSIAPNSVLAQSCHL